MKPLSELTEKLYMVYSLWFLYSGLSCLFSRETGNGGSPRKTEIGVGTS